MVRAGVLILAFAVVVGIVGLVGAARKEDPGEHEVVRTASGWVPATITIETGDAVVFVNESADEVWPASDVHPTHELYPGFDSERGVPAARSWSYTFDRPGRWGYHDHLSPETQGVIVVR